MSLKCFKIKKTLTLPAPVCGLPAWLSGSCSPYDIIQVDDRHHWLPRPQEGDGPLLLSPCSLQGPPSQPGPLTGDPSASSAHGFSSSNRRGQWCHTKVRGGDACQGPCPVIGPGRILYDRPRPGLLGRQAKGHEVSLPVPSPHLLFITPTSLVALHRHTLDSKRLFLCTYHATKPAHQEDGSELRKGERGG